MKFSWSSEVCDQALKRLGTFYVYLYVVLLLVCEFDTYTYLVNRSAVS